jgi:hypothetical protein
MTRIALITRLAPATEAAWVQHLRHAMLTETFDSFYCLTPAQRAKVDIAIVGIVKLRDISKVGTWAHDQTQAIWCLFRPPFPT